jgi:transcriptional regulator with XRE-family HTH domain
MNKSDESDGPLRPDRLMTVNRVMGHNLRRARQERGWTQEQAAERLQPYLGALWSKQTFSAAEQGFEREFSVNELIALARGFNREPNYFFEPPPSGGRIYNQRPPAELVRRLADAPGLKEILEIETEEEASNPARSLRDDQMRDLIKPTPSYVVAARLRALADDIERRS